MSDPSPVSFKALLVEGVPGIGKSTVIDALIRRHANSTAPRKIRTLVHLAQSHTYGPLARAEDSGTLTVEQSVAHLERIAGIIEWLHAGVQEHRKPWCFVVIDTLHLTHCLRPGVVEWTDVVPIDRRLAQVGCKLLLLTGTRDTIWRRSIEDRTESQFLEYARKFGRTDADLHAHFAGEQVKFRGMFERSEMPRISMSNDGDVEDVVDTAYRFWRDETRRTAAVGASTHAQQREEKG
jgi:hypothetical protein